MGGWVGALAGGLAGGRAGRQVGVQVGQEWEVQDIILPGRCRACRSEMRSSGSSSTSIRYSSSVAADRYRDVSSRCSGRSAREACQGGARQLLPQQPAVEVPVHGCR